MKTALNSERELTFLHRIQGYLLLCCFEILLGSQYKWPQINLKSHPVLACNFPLELVTAVVLLMTASHYFLQEYWL